jgi:hypothetical protein
MVARIRHRAETMSQRVGLQQQVQRLPVASNPPRLVSDQLLASSSYVFYIIPTQFLQSKNQNISLSRSVPSMLEGHRRTELVCLRRKSGASG